MKNISLQAQRAMGLAAFDVRQHELFERERDTLQTANQILGFGKA